jgi:hypothetical protein
MSDVYSCEKCGQERERFVVVCQARDKAEREVDVQRDDRLRVYAEVATLRAALDAADRLRLDEMVGKARGK